MSADLGDEIEYTGQGACDNLGNKQQVRDQTWTSANLSLKTSMELKIPVR